MVPPDSSPEVAIISIYEKRCETCGAARYRRMRQFRWLPMLSAAAEANISAGGFFNIRVIFWLLLLRKCFPHAVLGPHAGATVVHLYHSVDRRCSVFYL